MSKKRILLVEDDRGLQVTLRYILEDMGYEIVIAEDHAQTHAAIANGPYAAAIVDYFLNNIPSTDLISSLRRSYPKMPLLCSTAAYAEQIKLDAATVRPDAFLYKPFGAAQLRETLLSLVAS